MRPRIQPPEGPGSPWAPYEPTPEAPWDLRRVVHLHRRAGFAATWAESPTRPEGRPRSQHLPGPGRDLPDRQKSPRSSSRPRPSWPTRRSPRATSTGSGPGGPSGCSSSPDPLGERLTLMWHDHFATARSKVEDLALMRRQNDTLRRLARGSFGELLNQAVREPALLLYLDAPSNRKGHPNENLARELMELFTLGIGPLHRGRRPAGRPSPHRLDGRGRRVPRTPHPEARRRREGHPRPQRGLDRLRPPGDPARPARDLEAARPPDLRPLDGRTGDATTWAIDQLADDLRGEPPGHRPTRSRRCSALGRSSPRRTSARGSSGRSSSSSGPAGRWCRIGSSPSTLILADWFGPAGPGVVRAAQRRRLAGGSGVADASRSLVGSGQLRRRARGRPSRRPPRAARRRGELGQRRSCFEVRRAASALLLGGRTSINPGADPDDTPEAARRRPWPRSSPRPKAQVRVIASTEHPRDAARMTRNRPTLRGEMRSTSLSCRSASTSAAVACRRSDSPCSA